MAAKLSLGCDAVVHTSIKPLESLPRTTSIAIGSQAVGYKCIHAVISDVEYEKNEECVSRRSVYYCHAEEVAISNGFKPIIMSIRFMIVSGKNRALTCFGRFAANNIKSCVNPTHGFWDVSHVASKCAINAFIPLNLEESNLSYNSGNSALAA
ncbi:hypothetical protein ACH5RR_012997 [Cinchona calisaya]|uniref:Uncharacterized protein n=1 Tax=Cinchona calisaya TaxID=153742 RepID=A0ABD3A274_9GENT